MPDKPPLDETHYRETLDRVFLFLDIFSRHILDSVAVQAEPQLLEAAERVATELGNLYVLSGRALFERAESEEAADRFAKDAAVVVDVPCKASAEFVTDAQRETRAVLERLRTGKDLG